MRLSHKKGLSGENRHEYSNFKHLYQNRGNPNNDATRGSNSLKRKLNDQERGFLIGVRQISGYMGVGYQTFYRLYRQHGLPVTILPDRRYCSAKSLLDGWLEVRWKMQAAAAANNSGEAA